MNIYIMEYYSTIKKNEMPFATTWMNRGIIILSEVNQRNTNIMLSMWNLKNYTGELIYIENKYMVIKGEGVEIHLEFGINNADHH